MPAVSLLRRMSRFPLNMEPSVDSAVKGRAGILSAPELAIVMYEEFSKLLRRLHLLARSQKALSLSSGLVGGRSLILLPPASVVIDARVGSISNEPLAGSLAVLGVLGRDADEAPLPLEVVCLAASGVLGVALARASAAFFLSGSLATCSSRVSSSVLSPSSSALHHVSTACTLGRIATTYNRSCRYHRQNRFLRQLRKQASHPRLRSRSRTPYLRDWSYESRHHPVSHEQYAA